MPTRTIEVRIPLAKAVLGNEQERKRKDKVRMRSSFHPPTHLHLFQLWEDTAPLLPEQLEKRPTTEKSASTFNKHFIRCAKNKLFE